MLQVQTALHISKKIAQGTFHCNICLITDIIHVVQMKTD